MAEILKGRLKIILVSMHLDRENPTDMTAKIEAVLRHAKGTGLLIATDRNARSTLWHDTLTNTRGRILEEFITSHELYSMNEDCNNTTYRNHMGTSNFDLTILSPS